MIDRLPGCYLSLSGPMNKSRLRGQVLRSCVKKDHSTCPCGLDSRIAETKEAAEKDGGTDFKAEKEEASKYTSQADCEAQNDGENMTSDFFIKWPPMP